MKNRYIMSDKDEIIYLESKLANAVSLEEFEFAALLRNRIKELMDRNNEIQLRLPGTAEELKSSTVYILGHNLSAVRIGFVLETVKTNTEVKAVKDDASSGILYIVKGQGKPQTSQDLDLPEAVIDCVRFVSDMYADKFLEEMYNTICDERPQYVIVDGLEELLFTLSPAGSLESELDWMLHETRKIAAEFRLPIIFTTAQFYKKGDTFDGPLFIPFYRKKVIKVEVYASEQISVSYCRALLLYELASDHAISIEQSEKANFLTGIIT